MFLVIQNFGCGIRKRSVPRATLETKISSPVDVVNRYYKYIFQKNFGACYNLLDKKAQSQLSKVVFIKRMRINYCQRVIPLNINHICLVDNNGNIAHVTFDLKSRISIVEAKWLNKLGILYAKPGIYIFHSQDSLIIEDGQWRIMKHKR